MKLERQLELAKASLLRTPRFKGADFEVYIVSNKEMEKVRRTLVLRPDFKGAEAKKIAKEKIVNVLAFPHPGGFPDPDPKKKMLGEIYLNGGYGTRDYAALGPLLVHGFLHLLGYRHYFERDRIKMQRLEQRLWKDLENIKIRKK